MKRRLEFAVDLDPFSAVMMIWVDDLESLDPGLRAERERLREQMRELLMTARDAFPYWSVPPLGINFDARLFRRLRRVGLHGPLWQHLRGPLRLGRDPGEVRDATGLSG